MALLQQIVGGILPNQLMVGETLSNRIWRSVQLIRMQGLFRFGGQRMDMLVINADDQHGFG